MPTVQFSNKELLRDKLVKPDWYKVLVTHVGEWTPSKDKQSQNMVIESEIVCNAENGSEEFVGVPIGGMGTWSFNSKAIGFALGLVKAFCPQFGLDPDTIDAQSRFEFKNFEGKMIEVFIDNNDYEGRLRNKVEHKYRAIRPAA